MHEEKRKKNPGVSTYGGIDVHCNYSRLRREKTPLSCETMVMNVPAHYLGLLLLKKEKIIYSACVNPGQKLQVGIHNLPCALQFLCKY